MVAGSGQVNPSVTLSPLDPSYLLWAIGGWSRGVGAPTDVLTFDTAGAWHEDTRASTTPRTAANAGATINLRLYGMWYASQEGGGATYVLSGPAHEGFAVALGPVRADATLLGPPGSSPVMVLDTGLALTALPGSVGGTIANFKENESVQFRLDNATTGTVLGSTTIGPTGLTTFAVTVPVGTANGDHQIYAVGSQGSQANDSFNVNVVVLTPLMSTVNPSTITSLPQALTGSLSGYGTGENVVYRLDNATSGTVLTGSTTPTPIGAAHTATFSATVPGGTPNGTHVLYAIGSGGSVASRSFIVNVGATNFPTTVITGGGTLTGLPGTVSGSLTHYLNAEVVTFRLDNSTTGTVVGTVTADGSGAASFSITIPIGVTNGNHVLYAVGGGGSLSNDTFTVNIVTTTPTMGSLSPVNITTLPQNVAGSLQGYVQNETLQFRLDSAGGPLLQSVMSPAIIGGAGTATFSVTLPVGTANGAHVLYAVGSQGSTSSRSFNVNVQGPGGGGGDGDGNTGHPLPANAAWDPPELYEDYADTVNVDVAATTLVHGATGYTTDPPNGVLEGSVVESRTFRTYSKFRSMQFAGLGSDWRAPEAFSDEVITLGTFNHLVYTTPAGNAGTHVEIATGKYLGAGVGNVLAFTPDVLGHVYGARTKAGMIGDTTVGAPGGAQPMPYDEALPYDEPATYDSISVIAANGARTSAFTRVFCPDTAFGTYELRLYKGGITNGALVAKREFHPRPRTWEEIDLVYQAQQDETDFTVAVFQVDATVAEPFAIDSLGIFQAPIRWEVSNDGGLTWQPVVFSVGDPKAFVTFPGPNNLLRIRAMALAPYASVTGWTAVPWYIESPLNRRAPIDYDPPWGISDRRDLLSAERKPMFQMWHRYYPRRLALGRR